MKKLTLLLMSVVLVFALTACGGSSEKPADTSGAEMKTEASETEATTVEVKKETKSAKVTTAEEMAKGLVAAGLQITDLIVYTQDTDENHLMGKPHQYKSKVNFKEGSIEVFANKSDAEARKSYIDELGKSMSSLAEYSVIIDNVLLRFTDELKEEGRTKYTNELEKLLE